MELPASHLINIPATCSYLLFSIPFILIPIQIPILNPHCNAAADVCLCALKCCHLSAARIVIYARATRKLNNKTENL